jgi:hypothetical protein
MERKEEVAKFDQEMETISSKVDQKTVELKRYNIICGISIYVKS